MRSVFAHQRQEITVFLVQVPELQEEEEILTLPQQLEDFFMPLEVNLFLTPVRKLEDDRHRLDEVADKREYGRKMSDGTNFLAGFF